MKKTMIMMTVIFSLAGSSLAFGHGYHNPPYHGHPGYGHGYDDGFLAGLLVSTYLVAITAITHGHKELVYVGAADEAAAFLAEGNVPSPLLREAMDTERDLLLGAGVPEAKDLSDEDLAFMILGRVHQLQSAQ